MRAALIAAGVLVAGVVSAAVIVEQENFDGDEGDFADVAGYGSFAYNADIDASGRAGVQIDAAADSAPHTDLYLASVNTEENLTGNYISGAGVGAGGIPVLGISFDFYIDADNTDVPSELNIYFSSSSGNSWRWLVDGYTTMTTGWQTYGANFNPTSAGSWESVSGLGNDVSWAADLTAITDIGIEIGYLVDDTAQIYGFDEFTLYGENFLVPEPETYLVLGMALLSVVVVFRKRINESLAEVRAMLMV